MPNPETCPWCGMERKGYNASFSFLWKCGTKQNAKGSRIQSEACAQIAQLEARIKKLERVRDAAWEALETAMFALEAPDEK